MISFLINEWKQVLTNFKLVVAIIVILFVPSLYSGTYLWANWDPYAHLERLPVAVVNDDEKVEYQGSTYEIGDDLIKELKKDQSFKWEFVSNKQADQGLKNNHYYFEVYIPKDFSKRATTLTNQKPMPLNLYYKVNAGSNFIASQIGRTGVDKIRTNLSEQLSKNYAEVVFTQLKTVGDHLNEASNGSGKISTGLEELVSGTNEIVTGMEKEVGPLGQLSSGTTKLSEAASQLSTGAEQLQSGMSQVTGGMTELGKGLSSLNSSADQLAAGMEPLTNGSKQLNQAVQGYQSTHPDWADDPTFQQIVQLSQGLNGGVEKFQSNFSSFQQGINQANQSIAPLSSGAQTIETKLGDLSQGAKQMAASQSDATTGTKNVVNGWESVIGHLKELRSGEDQLSTGSKDLTSQLANGAKELQDIHSGKPIYEMMANPVRLKEQLVHNVPNYGTGLAPYFLSLSLFVGALLLSTILPLRETAANPPSAIAWFLSKFILLGLISLGQTIITSLILIHIIGLDPIHKGELYLFTFLTSLLFMAIILFLVITADNAGRFVAIILLVLQLTSSAGTFPIELTPTFLQTLHSLLPMSYSVEGFRAIISTGDVQLLRGDVMVLVLYLLAAVVLTILIIRLLLKKQTKIEKA